MNNTISWLAPKNKCYGGSQSLCNRISIAVSITTSLGMHRYFTRLFHALGITMTPNIDHFLSLRETRRLKRIAHGKGKEEQKKLRKEKVFEKLRNDEKIKRNESRKKYGVYQTGIDMEDPETYGWVKSPPEAKQKQSLDAVVCKHCGLAGHSRTSSWKCLKHKAQPEAAAAAVLPPEAQDSEEDAASDLDREEGLTLGVEHLQMFPDDADTTLSARKNNNLNDDDEDSEVQQAHIL
jgi:hypothetical protein